jgi:hypothetical protein
MNYKALIILSGVLLIFGTLAFFRNPTCVASETGEKKRLKQQDRRINALYTGG